MFPSLYYQSSIFVVLYLRVHIVWAGYTICYFGRAGECISEPLSDILYNILSDELFKHPAQIESLVLSCR